MIRGLLKSNQVDLAVPSSSGAKLFGIWFLGLVWFGFGVWFGLGAQFKVRIWIRFFLVLRSVNGLIQFSRHGRRLLLGLFQFGIQRSVQGTLFSSVQGWDRGKALFGSCFCRWINWWHETL